MNPDPALPVLRAAAGIMLARPGLAGQGLDVGTFAVEHRQMILDALVEVPSLRAAVRRAGPRIPRDRPREAVLAALLLSPHGGTARAGVRVAEQFARDDAARERLRRRYQDRLQQSGDKLRIESARREQAALALSAAEVALADAERRAEELDTQVSALHRRAGDPRALATGLLRSLRRPAAEGGAEARDPRNPPPAAADPHDPALAVAASAAGITPEALVAALQAIVAPPPPSGVPRAGVVRERGLTVHPLGGGTEIGGSCVLVEAGETRLLVDAGLRPGDPAQPPGDIAHVLPGMPPDAVVVTHAHVDHCGYVPALAARLPGLRILATPETTFLMPRMWADSARLMRDRGRLHRDWGAAGEALYGREDVEEAVRRCEEVPVGVERVIGDVTVELFPAGHVLGAAGVVVRAGEQRVVVTGDISGFRQETVDGYRLPGSALDADLLVMESTCCAEDHAPRETRVGDLVKAVSEVCAAGGRVLIPAFALGRAQEIALLMRTHLPHVPVLVDGMAADVTASFERLTAAAPAPLQIFGGNVARARRPADLRRFTSGVVITTSGMLTGGPAVQWAAQILPEAHSALFLSGYQDEESGGAALLRLAGGRASHLTLHDGGRDTNVPLRARVEMMRLSAHADRRGLLDIAEETGPREIMLVHGVPHRQRDFREVLQVRGHTTVATGLWK
ncbi:MBL fold metallo-hydrolase [Sphaerisporangium aureirubrum]|uniref:MBL fold metallo-hydrolase n=1 Tax=Sphaerisporangium aureirubrum TaxID=1544736 RepID=A0ABW1NIT0_9ACTN